MKNLLKLLLLTPAALFAAAPVPTDIAHRMMGELGGMEIRLNPPSGASNNIRLRSRGGEKASDFPPPMVVDKPVNTNAN